MSGSFAFRRFKLINAIGEEYDLCDTRHFFSNPDGLGFEKEITSSQTGDFFVPVNQKNRQQTITGEIIFSGYEEYASFKEFVAGDDLIFSYCPAFCETWYYRSCVVKALKKSEISPSTQHLHCNIDFLCFSQWYESVIAKKTVFDASKSAFFSGTFPLPFSDVSINEVSIENPKTVSAPCRIEILGPCSNPSWSLIQYGKTVANGRVNVILDEGESLVIDANVESMRIVKATEQGETNVYQLSDYSTDRFIYAPSGKSLLRFYHDDGYALDVTVEVKLVSDTV